jgi:gamma-glutamylcyclotransferase (GGCT)/AIG2-like uncharacterized protein YtfP
MVLVFVYGSLLKSETWHRLGLEMPTTLSTATIPKSAGFVRVRAPQYIRPSPDGQSIRGKVLLLDSKQLRVVTDYEHALGFSLRKARIQSPASTPPLPAIYMFLPSRI